MKRRVGMNNKLKSSQQVKSLRFLANLTIGGLVILAGILIFPHVKQDSKPANRPMKVWVKKKPLINKESEEILDVDYSIEKLKIKDQTLEIHNSLANGIRKKKSLELLNKKREIIEAIEDVQLKISLHQADPQFEAADFKKKMKDLDQRFKRFELENPTLTIEE